MAASSTKKWWKNSIVYQIYPRTFCDSNGDGIGDIPGIISRLHYLKNLGVDAILLNPIFPSPLIDRGYDISDFKAIDPDLGTMEDMERLISRAKRVGIKILLDISINNTSDEHEWFQRALLGEEKYRNYYIFSDSRGIKKPNNWSGLNGHSAWSKGSDGCWYLSLMGKNMPDLNWNNPEVYDEMASVMRFWLDKGIAGFKLDTINALYKCSLENGKFDLTLKGREHFLNTDGCHALLKKFNDDVWSNYKCFIVGETVLAKLDDSRMLSNEERKELDSVFFFGRIDADSKICNRIRKRHNANKLIKLVDKGQQTIDYPINYLETGAEANFVKFFGNDKQNCLKFAKLLTGLNFSLKGLPFISEGETVEEGDVENDPTSLYNFTAKMIDFRKKSKALSEGVYHRVASQNDVYIFTREAKEERLYLYSNFTPYNKIVEFYGDRIVFSNYDVDGLEGFCLKPYEFRIVASNI